MKTLKNLFKIAAIGVFAFAICACSSVNTVQPANSAASKKMVSDKRVITDEGLEDIAFVAGVNESRTPLGLLKIQVELVNRSESVRNVNYSFEWFDRDGMLINTPSPIWITMAIDAGESRYVSAVAPSQNAADFRLKLLGDVREY